jgi:hypothetical protein
MTVVTQEPQVYKVAEGALTEGDFEQLKVGDAVQFEGNDRDPKGPRIIRLIVPAPTV